MSDWIILRTSGPSTLRLSTSLTEAGFEVWTPLDTDTAKDGSKTVTAMIKTFVFARAAHLVELVTLSRSPSLLYRVWDKERRRMVAKGHPTFSVFKHNGQFSMIPEVALAHLRRFERRRKPRGLVKAFAIGARVKLTEGAWAGLSGVVVAVKGKSATVSFPTAGYVRDVSLPMDLLLDDEPLVHVSSGNSERATEARAA